jgi:hypothetical protein
MRLAFLLSLTLGCAACSTVHHNDHVVKSASADQKAALLDRVKSLAGTWDGTSADGPGGAVMFQVTSGGSAVREIMFPGAEHEMTNMYTMDGSDLLMTHYCAMGNQPLMRAAAADGNRIAFRSAGVSNLTAPDQMYMGEMTITFINANHIRQQWQSLKNGKPSDHRTTFDLKRRQ